MPVPKSWHNPCPFQWYWIPSSWPGPAARWSLGDIASGSHRLWCRPPLRRSSGWHTARCSSRGTLAWRHLPWRPASPAAVLTPPLATPNTETSTGKKQVQARVITLSHSILNEQEICNCTRTKVDLIILVFDLKRKTKRNRCWSDSKIIKTHSIFYAIMLTTVSIWQRCYLFNTDNVPEEVSCCVLSQDVKRVARTEAA